MHGLRIAQPVVFQARYRRIILIMTSRYLFSGYVVAVTTLQTITEDQARTFPYGRGVLSNNTF